MGLSFGLERGQVSGENLNKARTMVPRALEQYVVELAAKGPGIILKYSFLSMISSWNGESYIFPEKLKKQSRLGLPDK